MAPNQSLSNLPGDEGNLLAGYDVGQTEMHGAVLASMEKRGPGVSMIREGGESFSLFPESAYRMTPVSPLEWQEELVSRVRGEREAGESGNEENENGLGGGHNRVDRMAREICEMLERNPGKLVEMEALIQGVAVKAFLRDMELKARQVDYMSKENVQELMRGVVRGMIYVNGEDGEVREYDGFVDRLNIETVLVMTGHPVYAVDGELLLLGQLVGAGKVERDVAERILMSREIAPDDNITLDKEHEMSEIAGTSLFTASMWLDEVVIEEIARAYPERLMEYEPRIIGFDNWNLGDTDGRKDVRLPDSFEALKGRRLTFVENYKRALEGVGLEGGYAYELLDGDIEKICSADMVRDALNEDLRKILGVEEVEGAKVDGLDGLTGGDLDKVKVLISLKGHLHYGGVFSTGLHVRTNQRNILNKRGYEKEYGGEDEHVALIANLMDDLNDLVDDAEHRAENIVMMLRKILREVNDGEVEYLIAETDGPDAALLLLKMMKKHDGLGGEDEPKLVERVNILPLFEDVNGVAVAHEVMDRLRKDEEMRKYIIAKGSEDIETGHSDLGRFAGQAGAALLLPKFYMAHLDGLNRFVHEHKDEFPELMDVDVRYFPTPGQSTGRGFIPQGFGATTRYLMMPKVREHRHFKEFKSKLMVWQTLQGGNGLNYIFSPEMAFNTIKQILLELWRDVSEEEISDPFLESEFVGEFLGEVVKFNQELMNSNTELGKSYGALLFHLGAIGFPNGSRAILRTADSEGKAVKKDRGVADVRAISHNNHLGQLAYMSNCLVGVGRAFEKIDGAEEKLRTMLHASPRLRLVMESLYHSYRYSDLESFMAKIAAAHNQEAQSELVREFLGDKGENCDLVVGVLVEEFLKVGKVIDVYERERPRIAEMEGWKVDPPSEEKRARLRMIDGVTSGLIRYLNSVAAANQEVLSVEEISAIHALELHMRLGNLEALQEKVGELGEAEKSNGHRKDVVRLQIATVFRLIQRMANAKILEIGFVG